MRQVLASEAERIAGEIARNGAGTLTDEALWTAHQAALADAVTPIFDGLVAYAVGAARNSLGNIQAPAINWGLINQNAVEQARQYTYDLVSGITDTTRAALQNTLSDWIANPAPLSSLIEDVTNLTDGTGARLFGPVRAEMIAVTESTRVYADANSRAWEAAGAQPAVLKAPLHVNCILPGNAISIPGRIVVATKSFYIGRCIEVSLADGRHLAVTENHPILTARGWVAAKLLHKGDKVVGASIGQESLFNPNNDNRPTMIEEIFDSLVKNGSMFTMRMPVSAKDFHGDGRGINGDVDVIYMDSFLKINRYSALSEHFTQGKFISGCTGKIAISADGMPNSLILRNDASACGVMSSGNLRSALDRSHPAPFDGFRVRLTTRLDTDAQETPAKGHALNSGLFGQGVFGFSAQVSLNQRIQIRNGDSLSGPILIDAGTLEETSNGIETNAALVRKFFDRFAGLIIHEQVIDVREFNYSGHVYDLQVDPFSLYLTNGIVTSNCRCYLQPYRLLDGSFVIVWYTGRDDLVCPKPGEQPRQYSTPWGEVDGCRALHRVVVSEGPYLGLKLDDAIEKAKNV